MGVGLALYALASVAELAAEDPIIKHTVKCKYCRKRINVKAKRCINCTSECSNLKILVEKKKDRESRFFSANSFGTYWLPRII